MHSTIYEVDEDVFQITTEYDDGTVVVETVHGRDAYEAHSQKEMKSNGQRDEHTFATGRQRRIARESYRISLFN